MSHLFKTCVQFKLTSTNKCLTTTHDSLKTYSKCVYHKCYKNILTDECQHLLQ